MTRDENLLKLAVLILALIAVWAWQGGHDARPRNENPCERLRTMADNSVANFECHYLGEHHSTLSGTQKTPPRQR